MKCKQPTNPGKCRRFPILRFLPTFATAQIQGVRCFCFIICLLFGTLLLADHAESPRLRGFTMPNSPAEVKDAAALHANAIRLMYTAIPQKNADGGIHYDLTAIKKFLDEAQKNHLAVIIDLHSIQNPEHKNYRKDRNGQSADFWNDLSNLDLMKTFWIEVATLCKDNPQRIWYDLYNEPLDWNDVPSYPKKWPEWAQVLINVIRKIDSRHEIVIEPGPGGICWGFRTFPLLKGENLIYSAHNYQPHAYTHQGISSLANTDLARAYLKTNQPWPGEYSDVGGGLWNAKRLEEELAPVINFQKKHHVRIYIGEFGVIRWAPNADRYLHDNLELFEKYGWDWTYHAFREYNGWSFEYEPTFGKEVKAVQETNTAKVIKKFLAHNLQPEKFSVAKAIKDSPDDPEQNEYADAGVGIRVDVISNDVIMAPDTSPTGGKVCLRPWGTKDGSEKKHLYFDQRLNSGYGWQNFTFSFIPENDGNVLLALSGIYYNDPKTQKQIDTWTCYDDIKVTGIQTPLNGSFELLDANGMPQSWNMGKGTKLIEDGKSAAKGNNYVMGALEHYIGITMKVKTGQKVTICGMAKRAGRFEHNYVVNEKKLSFVKSSTISTMHKNPGEYVILFKGNSITRHGFNAETVKTLGWDHEAGMAASTAQKDYAHLLAEMIQNALPSRKVRLVFGSQDSSSAATDVLYAPDLVIVQTGEHSQTSQEKVNAFPSIYTQTLDTILKRSEEHV